jgi:predicted Fe-Mo cluster-binding NifX family protein
MNMKIAVATTDGVSISQHFGQSAGFIVFEVDGTNVKQRELRTNNQTLHDQGICQHHGPEQEQALHGHGAHSHAGITGMLGDCKVVLCGGMGAGAAQALRQQGIQPLLLSVTCTADEAVSQYLKGALITTPTEFCKCQH